MKSTFIIVLSLIILVFSCKTTVNTDTNNTVNNTIPKREHSVQALLWQQQSAEYKALTHQAFNLAKMYLDDALANKTTNSKPFAIVTDIDETVLDNSPYNARMVKSDEDYTSKTWYAWGKEKKAKAVPGALDFFNYTDSRGVAIYYISNRNQIQLTETIANLKAKGFPNVNTNTVLLKTTTSGKEIRRNSVEKTHEIIMLLGDNLSDFSELFDNQSTKKRNNLVEELKLEFGKKFIVFPNPMYGDWETKGIYESSYKWSDFQKDSIRKSKLRLH